MSHAALALMPHRVVIESVTAYSAAGVPTYGVRVETPAMVTATRQSVAKRDGTETIARGVAYCAGPFTVSADAVVTVPTQFGWPERMPVLTADVFCDGMGAIDNVRVVF